MKKFVALSLIVFSVLLISCGKSSSGSSGTSGSNSGVIPAPSMK